jgi:hypothetical protein
MLIVLACLVVAAAALAGAGCTARDGPNATAASTAVPGDGAAKSAARGEVSEEQLVTAKDLQGDWETDWVGCSEESCVVSFTNGAGDSATSMVASYDTDAAAHTELASIRADVGDQVSNVQLGDEGYGYAQGDMAEVGFRKGKTVVISTFVAASGSATMDHALGIALAAAEKV